MFLLGPTTPEPSQWSTCCRMFQNPSQRINLSLLKGQKPVGLLQDYSGWISTKLIGALWPLQFWCGSRNTFIVNTAPSTFLQIMVVINMVETNTKNSCTFHPEPFFCALRSRGCPSHGCERDDSWENFYNFGNKRPFKWLKFGGRGSVISWAGTCRMLNADWPFFNIITLIKTWTGD